MAHKRLALKLQHTGVYKINIQNVQREEQSYYTKKNEIFLFFLFFFLNGIISHFSNKQCCVSGPGQRASPSPRKNASSL